MPSLSHWLHDVSSFFSWKRDPVEELVCELDEGKYDTALLAEAGEPAPSATARYADIKPFDYRPWAKIETD